MSTMSMNGQASGQPIHPMIQGAGMGADIATDSRLSQSAPLQSNGTQFAGSAKGNELLTGDRRMIELKNLARTVAASKATVLI